MKHIHHALIATLLSAAFSTAWADTRLVGEWTSVDAPNGALHGTIKLGAKGDASLAAKEQPVLEGAWEAPKAGELKLTMGEYGSSLMKYRFNKEKLVLTYDNGNEQTFAKQPTAKAKKK